MEKSNFKMVGFKHITENGVASFWSMMDSWGTIGLLWDLSNQMKADALMCEKDFCLSLYIEKQFGLTPDDDGFDELMIELHEELCDARFALEYAFAMSLTSVISYKGERSFYNLDKLPQSTEWVQGTVYPTELQHFDDYEELGNYCQDTLTTIGPDYIHVIVRATGEGHPDQELCYRVSGAQEYNAIIVAVNGLIEAEYTNFSYLAR